MSEMEKKDVRQIAEVFKNGTDFMRGRIAGYAEAIQELGLPGSQSHTEDEAEDEPKAPEKKIS